MTIQEAKSILNRAGYRVTESSGSWEKDEELGWLKNRRMVYTDNSFPGSLYEGIYNNLVLMGGTIDSNDPNGRAIQEALWKVERLVGDRLGTDSDIPEPLTDDWTQ